MNDSGSDFVDFRQDVSDSGYDLVTGDARLVIVDRMLLIRDLIWGDLTYDFNDSGLFFFLIGIECW